MRRPAGREGGRVDGPEDRSSLERCITWGLPTANLPGCIQQQYSDCSGTRLRDDHPRNGPRHSSDPVGRSSTSQRRDPPMVRRFAGRWEGDTLVVETTNFSDKTNYRGSGANLRLVERFKRVDTDAIGYELTVDDPTTWVRSWTAAFSMRPSEGPIYEYACHEANMSLMNMLEVARDEEKALSKKWESGKWSKWKVALRKQGVRMRREFIAGCAVVVLLLAAPPVRAHHSFAAEFDLEPAGHPARHGRADGMGESAFVDPPGREERRWNRDPVDDRRRNTEHPLQTPGSRRMP